MGLRLLACWDYGFEFRQEHGCLSVVNVVFCHIQLSASVRSLVQRSPNECVCVIECDQVQQTSTPTISSRNSSRLWIEERKKEKERKASSKSSGLLLSIQLVTDIPKMLILLYQNCSAFENAFIMLYFRSLQYGPKCLSRLESSRIHHIVITDCRKSKIPCGLCYPVARCSYKVCQLIQKLKRARTDACTQQTRIYPFQFWEREIC